MRNGTQYVHVQRRSSAGEGLYTGGVIQVRGSAGEGKCMGGVVQGKKFTDLECD